MESTRGKDGVERLKTSLSNWVTFSKAVVLMGRGAEPQWHEALTKAGHEQSDRAKMFLARNVESGLMRLVGDDLLDASEVWAALVERRTVQAAAEGAMGAEQLWKERQGATETVFDFSERLENANAILHMGDAGFPNKLLCTILMQGLRPSLRAEAIGLKPFLGKFTLTTLTIELASLEAAEKREAEHATAFAATATAPAATAPAADALALQVQRMQSQLQQQSRQLESALAANAARPPRPMQTHWRAGRGGQFRGHCCVCGKYGHRGIECSKAAAPDRSDGAVPAVVCKPTSWLIDSGATADMCNDPSVMTNYQTLREPIGVRFGDGNVGSATGTGDVVLTTPEGVFRLSGVLHVPGLCINLLSVAKQWDQGVSVLFDADEGVVRFRRGHVLGICGPLHGGLFWVRSGTHHSAMTAHAEAVLLHRRMAHAGWRTLADMARNNQLTGSKLLPADFLQAGREVNCEPCVMAK